MIHLDRYIRAGLFRLERRHDGKDCALLTNNGLDRELKSTFELRIKVAETSRQKRAGMSRQASNANPCLIGRLTVT